MFQRTPRPLGGANINSIIKNPKRSNNGHQRTEIVTALGRHSLPPLLQELAQEVGHLARVSIHWKESPDIAGAMSSAIEDGVPVICYRAFSEGGAAEELMHLRLTLSGMPRLSFPAGLSFVGQTATMLQNTMDHHLIFPELAKLGYDPWSSESRGVAKQLDGLNLIDSSRLQSEPQLNALVSMAYARARLDCRDTSVLEQLDSVYSGIEFLGARKSGEQIVSAVLEESSPRPESCRATIATCLGILGLSNVVTIS